VLKDTQEGGGGPRVLLAARKLSSGVKRPVKMLTMSRMRFSSRSFPQQGPLAQKGSNGSCFILVSPNWSNIPFRSGIDFVKALVNGGIKSRVIATGKQRDDPMRESKLKTTSNRETGHNKLDLSEAVRRSKLRSSAIGALQSVRSGTERACPYVPWRDRSVCFGCHLRIGMIWPM
jgi:hypothetical protein